MAPPARLRGQAIQLVPAWQGTAVLDPKRERRRPIGVVRPDAKPNAHAASLEGRGKAGQPLSNLAIQPGAREIMHHGALHILFAENQPLEAVLLGAGKLDLDAPNRSRTDLFIRRAETVWIPDQACKHARAGPARPPKGRIIAQKRLTVLIEKELKRGRSGAMRPQMQTNIHMRAALQNGCKPLADPGRYWTQNPL